MSDRWWFCTLGICVLLACVFTTYIVRNSSELTGENSWITDFRQEFGVAPFVGGKDPDIKGMHRAQSKEELERIANAHLAKLFVDMNAKWTVVEYKPVPIQENFVYSEKLPNDYKIFLKAKVGYDKAHSLALSSGLKIKPIDPCTVYDWRERGKTDSVGCKP